MRRLLIAFLTASMLAASQAGAIDTRVSSDQLLMEGKKSLGEFSQLVTRENFRSMGFESPDEVKTASLGAPMKDFIVKLDSLSKYQPGGSAEELLIPTGQAVFPVMVNGKVRSSITLSKSKGEWKAVSFGGSNYVKKISKAVEESSRQTGLAKSEYFIARVPALNVFFAGYQREGKIFLVPIMDFPKFDLKAGSSVEAERALSALSQAAREHNGQPS